MGGVKLSALGGANTIGGSKLLLNYDDVNLMLDFGINYKALTRYYEEYLTPRSAAGLLDFVVMGLLPDVKGIYRNDLMHPSLKLRDHGIVRVDGVLISHAHMDHFGDLGFLRTDVPVGTSAMTTVTMKAMQDSGKTDIGRDCAYCKPKMENDQRGVPSFAAIKNQIVGRDFCVSDAGLPREFKDFWKFTPSEHIGRKKEKESEGLATGDILKHIPGVKYRAYPVDHSVLGAQAFVVSTSSGNIVYTGDIRKHGLAAENTQAFINAARASRPYALIVEGTRVGRESEEGAGTENRSEADVSESVRHLLPRFKDELVIADFGARNIERLRIFLAAAQENHREMVVTPKDAYLLHAMRTVDRSIPLPGEGIQIFNSPKGSEAGYEKWIMDEVYQDAVVNPYPIRKSPGDYLLAFGFFDIKHLVDLRPDKGHYIHSSCEFYTEDQEIDAIRLMEWLKKFNIETHGFGLNDEDRPVPNDDSGTLHASGHASPSDLMEIVRDIDPEVLIPVHTEHAHWFVENFEGERKVMVPDGDRWTSL